MLFGLSTYYALYFLDRERQFSLSESPADDEIKKLRHQLAKQKQECNDIIASLKEQYDRDIKNIHNKHDDAVAKLQRSHEGSVKEMKEDYEKEISYSREQLQKVAVGCQCKRAQVILIIRLFVLKI